MHTLLYIFVGGGLGALARYGLTHLSKESLGLGLWGTLSANLVGAFVMGGLMAWAGGTDKLSPSLQLGLTAGLLGGLTTFSTFSYETMELIRGGQLGWGALYGVGSLLACLVLCGLGYRLFMPIQG